MNVDARFFGMVIQALRRRFGEAWIKSETVNRLRDLSAEMEDVYRKAQEEARKEQGGDDGKAG